MRRPGGYPDPHRGEDPHQPLQRDHQTVDRQADPRLRTPPAQGAHQAGRHPRLIRHSVP